MGGGHILTHNREHLTSLITDSKNSSSTYKSLPWKPRWEEDVNITGTASSMHRRISRRKLKKLQCVGP